MPSTHANGKISILTHSLGGLRLPIIFLALLSVIAGATLAPRASGGAPMACLYTNRSQGPLYTVTVVERGLCGYGFEFDVDAISYQPTCYSNMTGSLFPFTSNPTMKLYAGRYWYQYHAYGSPFGGGEGNFTVSGPTTVYLNYSGVPANYCDNKQSVNASALNVTQPQNAIGLAQRGNQSRRISPLVQPQQLYNITFDEHGLNTSATWTVSVVNQDTGSNQTKNAAYPYGTSITFQLPNGYYSFGSYATLPYGSGGVGFFTVNDTPRTFNLTFANEEGPICTFFSEFAKINAGGNPLGAYYTDVGGFALFVLKLFGYCNTPTNVTGTGTSSTISTTTSTTSTSTTSTSTNTATTIPSSGTYSVTFTETGLQPGPGLCLTPWSCSPSWIVTMDGQTLQVASSSITFTALPDGNYNFVIVPPSGYSATNTSGAVTVNNADVNVNVAFESCANCATQSYDQQIIEYYGGQAFDNLTANVIAVAQTGPGGSGPAYLLNGYSNANYWYQVGLSYNWGCGWTGIITGGCGFGMNYQVFNDTGCSIFPAPNIIRGLVFGPCSGGGGWTGFSGTVNPGDKIQLEINFYSGNVGCWVSWWCTQTQDVLMRAYDLNTGAVASQSYYAYNANKFLADAGSAYPTGIMTEQYYTLQSQDYIPQQIVTYNTQVLPSAYIASDELNSQNIAVWDGVSDPQYYSFGNSYPTQLRNYVCSGAPDCSSPSTPTIIIAKVNGSEFETGDFS